MEHKNKYDPNWASPEGREVKWGFSLEIVEVKQGRHWHWSKAGGVDSTANYGRDKAMQWYYRGCGTYTHFFHWEEDQGSNQGGCNGSSSSTHKDQKEALYCFYVVLFPK